MNYHTKVGKCKIYYDINSPDKYINNLHINSLTDLLFNEFINFTIVRRCY